MRKKLTIAVLAVGMTLAMASLTTAQDVNDQQSDVSVSVEGVTAIDVRPSNLQYSSVTPGEKRAVSENGYEHIELENIGSERIGQIYAQGTMPTEQPFGTDASEPDAVQHNTGNFITLSLETANAGSYSVGGLATEDTPHYLNRVEYFEENPPTYITVDESGENYNGSQDFTVDSVDVGRFRAGGVEYFFAAYEGTGSQYALVIGDTPHTSTSLGTTDLSGEGSDVTEYVTSDMTNIQDEVYQVTDHQFVSFDTTDSGNYDGASLVADGQADFGSANISESDEDVDVRTYNLYPDFGNNYIIRTKFNVEQQSPDYDGEGTGYQLSDQSGEGAQQYIVEAGSTASDALQPGENFPVDIGIQVPQGVDQNAIQEGTVTLIASTYE